jgi:type I restriction enzyme S subunit
MQVQANTYLKYVELVILENWSVQGLIDSQFNYNNKFEQARIGDFLIKNRNIINIEDDKEYNRVTVKINNNGVILRDTEKGVNIGTKKQYRAKSGQFIISKIDARNGAFGIIPNELDNAIVTNDFPLFDVNTKKINPQFLLLITTTKVFLKFAQSCSSGTTNRQRMDIEMFLNQKIPLPKLEEQDKIVRKYFDKINEIEKLKIKVENLESNLESYFLEQLGSKRKEIKVFSSKLVIIEYKDLNRWDGKSEHNLTSKYDIQRIGKYITKISTGTTPPTSNQEYFIGDVNFYTPSELGEEMYLTNSERKLNKIAFRDKKARKFNKGTILFVGIGSTVGKVGIIANEFATSNQQITGFNVNQSILKNEYVYYYFKYFKEITISEQTKATLPIVNQEKILNIPIPVPSISIQESIVDQITKRKDEIEIIRIQIKKLQVTGQLEFEKAIFS